jgi:peptidyl-prolyl cis-trans isomerase C
MSALPWTKESLGEASKKQLVTFLQANASADFLSKHKLKGQEKAITKKSKMPALHAAFTEALDNIETVMPSLAAAARPATPMDRPMTPMGKVGAASHILIRHADDEDAEGSLRAIKKQIEDGGDFLELAKQHSTCPSAKSGGDLGTFPQGQMVKEFDQVVFDPANEKGVIYGPVKTKFGFHLIKITEPKSAEEGIRMIKHSDYLNDPEAAARMAQANADAQAAAIAAQAQRLAAMKITMPAEPRAPGVPGLEEMPQEVIARILRQAEPHPLVRLHLAATCAKLRTTVHTCAPNALPVVDFSSFPEEGNKLTNRGIKNIAKISGGKLTKIDLTGCMSLGRAVIGVLAKANPKLEELVVRFETSFSVQATTETCEMLLKHCPDFKRLSLDLREQKPTGEVLTLLNKATRGIVNVRMLELVPPNRSEQDGMQRMANETPPLLTLQEMRELISALQDGAELEELDVSFNRLGVSHMEVIMNGLAGVQTLSQLNLRFNGFADAGTHVIAAGLHGETAARLKWLDLSFNGVGIDGATSIGEALQEPSCVLERLNLKCNNVAEDGAEAIAEALRVNKTLKWLELGVNSIENGGTWELADCLEDNHTLEYLGLSGNGITADGIEFFPSAMRKNSGLRSLDLGMNKLADDGAKAVATMLASSQDEEGHDCMLSSVCIDQNGISDVGADALATALGGNSRLLNLRMRTNFVSGTQVSWLKTVADRLMPGVDRYVMRHCCLLPTDPSPWHGPRVLSMH